MFRPILFNSAGPLPKIVVTLITLHFMTRTRGSKKEMSIVKFHTKSTKRKLSTEDLEPHNRLNAPIPLDPPKLISQTCKH